MKNFFEPFFALLSRPKRNTFLWSATGLALLIRLGLIIFVSDPGGIVSDPNHILLYEHGWVAHNLYTGHGFSMNWPYQSLDSARRVTMSQPPHWEGAFLPPLNPYLLALSYGVFGETANALIAMMLLYAALSSLTPLVVYKLTRMLGSERSARLSVLVSLAFLPSAYAVVTFSGSAIYELLGIVVLYYSVKAATAPSWKSFLWLGLWCGIITMLRSEFLMLGFILIGAALLLAYRYFYHPGLARQALCAALLCIAIVAPWTVRNYMLFHKVVPVLSHPWYEIWRGNNILATGSNYDREGSSIWASPEMFPTLVRKMDSIPYNQQFEWRVDQLFKREVISFIEVHPDRFVWLGVKKLFFLFTFDPYYKLNQSLFYILPMLAISLLTLLGMISLLRDRARRPAMVILSLFFLYYIALTFMTVALPRYQIYVFTCMLPVTGLALPSGSKGYGGSHDLLTNGTEIDKIS